MRLQETRLHACKNECVSEREKQKEGEWVNEWASKFEVATCGEGFPQLYAHFMRAHTFVKGKMSDLHEVQISASLHNRAQMKKGEKFMLYKNYTQHSNEFTIFFFLQNICKAKD